MGYVPPPAPPSSYYGWPKVHIGEIMGRQPVPMTYPAEWLMHLFGGKPRTPPYQARLDTGNARLLRRVELAGYWLAAAIVTAVALGLWLR